MTARSPAFIARRLPSACAFVTPVQAVVPSFARSSHAYSPGSVLRSQYAMVKEVRRGPLARQRRDVAQPSRPAPCYMDPAMFGLSFGEIVIIAVLALLLLGPERLPDAARTLGKSLRELRKATEDMKDQIEHRALLGRARRSHAPRSSRPSPPRRCQGPRGRRPPRRPDNVPGLEAALAEPPGTEPLPRRGRAGGRRPRTSRSHPAPSRCRRPRRERRSPASPSHPPKRRPRFDPDAAPRSPA